MIMIRTGLCFVFSGIKLKVFILGKLSLYFLSFVFVPWLLPKTCRVFRERYMMDTSCNWHGKQLSLSSAKFRAVGSKPMLFTAKFRGFFVSKRKFNEIALFVQRKIRSKSLELSFELSHEISKKVRENKKKRKFVHFACVTFAPTVGFCKSWFSRKLSSRESPGTL